MREGIDAVAFDLDGTLYPNYRFYFRIIPFILREYRLLRAMGRARDTLRSGTAAGDFYALQAGLMASYLKDEPAKVLVRTEELIYRGWEPIFKKIKLYPYIHETLSAFRAAGLKLGLLSDFPAERKIRNLGLEKYWDTILCSENTGRLKPDKAPFIALAGELGTPPERILYVGNSVAYDVAGAKGAGMLAALVRPGPAARRRDGGADFVFSGYRQLENFVLH